MLDENYLLFQIFNKKPKQLENSQLLRKTWHVNQIFELILEQFVATTMDKNNEKNDKFICIRKWLILGLKAEKHLRN